MAPDPSPPKESVPLGAPVLVVDDDNAVRTLVSIALRRAGFEVIEASSGRAGLAVVEARNVGVVVMDVGMPEMSGTEVVRVLRRRPDSATLPVILMTGSGDDFSVIEGLSAGADDFLPKPVRLDELVARVRAHLRKHAAWSLLVEDELHARAGVVAALGRLSLSSEPEEAADGVVSELARRVVCDFVGVTQLSRGDQLIELATYSSVTGVKRGGVRLPPRLARDLIERARRGPWVEMVSRNSAGIAPEPSFAAADVEVVAGAPIYAGDQLVGLLSIGVGRERGRLTATNQAKLLAAAIDYASVLSAIAGPAIAGLRDAAATQSRLRHVLSGRQFHPVYQPIVDLETGQPLGYEALTRFADGTPPDERFAEATAAGLGSEFELAALAAAIEEAAGLKPDLVLTLNASPSVVLERSRRLRGLVRDTPRQLILELTEHVAIDDYAAIRKAIVSLGFAGVAVDDAGAGYASLRHILELQPRYAKLDISLVRDIDGNEVRQAMVAGLGYFAARTGCRLIAEGIETQAEADALIRLGVEYGQGYFYGRPEPLPR